MSSSFDIFKYGLLNFNERAKDSLFGEKQSVQPGQDTMRRSDEGLVNQSEVLLFGFVPTDLQILYERLNFVYWGLLFHSPRVFLFLFRE